MTHDLEYYLAYPFRWLAQWAGVDYSGEWRNGCAAHLGWGWALMFTLLSLNPWLCSVVILYPVYREANDSKWKILYGGCKFLLIFRKCSWKPSVCIFFRCRG